MSDTKSKYKYVARHVDARGEVLPGCVCEYLKESSRARLEHWIESNGGGEPGTNTSFANVLIAVNSALEKHLDRLEAGVPVRELKFTKQRAKKSGARLVR